ncbi:MAG: hypothetical protein FJ249_06905 [Nitrospira sp.]|nr:hypothetical protein [Nitrospira sp.]
MKSLVQSLLFGSLVITVLGCSLLIPKETLYLRSAQDQATQDEVQQQLGKPNLVSSTQAGEAVWVYQIREEEPGSRWTSIGMRCDEYVLTFDRQNVLRRWTYRTYVHGGELMPMYCVPGGMDDKRDIRG